MSKRKIILLYITLIAFLIGCIIYANVARAQLSGISEEIAVMAGELDEISRGQAEIEAAIIPECETPIAEEAEAAVESKHISLGEFRVTVYTPYCDGGAWGYQTATGVTSEHLSTCAVDPEAIPLGSIIEVNGLKLRAVDTGSAVIGNVIDVFFDGTKAEAMAWIAEFGTEHEVRISNP